MNGTSPDFRLVGEIGLVAAGMITGYELFGPMVCSDAKTIPGHTIGGIVEAIAGTGSGDRSSSPVQAVPRFRASSP